MVVAAGAWHAAVVGRDGRVCTWGWGRYGCLGHGNEECESVPKVVESLSNVKAIHVATGDYTTFVVSDDGDVYSFGCGESASLGHSNGADGQVWVFPTFSLLSNLLIWLKQVQWRDCTQFSDFIQLVIYVSLDLQYYYLSLHIFVLLPKI